MFKNSLRTLEVHPLRAIWKAIVHAVKEIKGATLSTDSFNSQQNKKEVKEWGLDSLLSWPVSPKVFTIFTHTNLYNEHSYF